ncbi:MAG: bacteriohemerythrin [Gammaproteobacteria bacterium]|nr:bacteriohemerythrin [Gammaproteobacteria bacterium]
MFYEWNEQLSVGVPSIDRQHKVLIALINELHEAMAKGAGPSAGKAVLKKVINYAQAHFVYEEGLFSGNQYALTEEHKESHRRIEKKLFALKQEADTPGFDVSDELMQFLKTWLNNHILKEDMGYSELLRKNHVQ